MCCHIRSASTCRRRRRSHRSSTPPLPLAVLDLSKPGERQAHDFLCRATSRPDAMWELISLRRHDDALLCVVRWRRLDDAAKLFSLATVSLTERAVCWRDCATAEAAQAELDRRSAERSARPAQIARSGEPSGR